MAAAETGRRQAEARARQAALWGRARSLCRRLRALQARQVERHVRQQLGGLARGAGRPEAGPPPAGLRSELRQLTASASARLRAAQRACDSDATDSASAASGSSVCASAASSSSSSSDSEGPEPPLPPATSERAGDVGCLDKIYHKENNHNKLTRHRLAEHQWAVERAAIICRWTWLQAQVLDLEYRIRQQTDVYKQLRANKGPVILGNLQHEDGLKQQSRLPSAAAMSIRRNKALSPSSSHLKNSHLAQSFRNLVYQNPSGVPINGSPEPSKACASPCQVNGISNCFSSCTPGGSPDGAGADRPVKKPVVLNHSLPAMVPPSLDNSCVAARIRPICRYKKRSLVRINTVSRLSQKPQKPLNMKCNCVQSNPCILCDFKTSVQTVEPETMSLEERVALLDSGFHPILSFPHGSPLHLHFETLLREDHRLSHELQTLKLPHSGLKDLTNNFCSTSLSTPGSLLKGLASRSLCAPNPQIHKPSSSQSASSLCLENTPVPHSDQVPGNAGGCVLQPAKKKKAECSYDINNIIIPVSMASATRVEKLQYKEILTPSWRMVDPKEPTVLEVDVELEDTSDETYLNYHQKFEKLERARWDSWTGTVSHRRGNRSSNKSDGRWMSLPGCLDMMSPSPHHFQGASSPVEPLSPEPSSALKPILSRDRIRGGASASEESALSSFDMDDEIQIVRPWEPRSFPLSDPEYQELQDPPCSVFGKQTSFVQWRDSGSNQALRTNDISASLFPSREAFLSQGQGHPEGGKQQLAEHHCVTPMLNNR